MTSASDDKSCVSKFNQVENDLQNYINAQLIILQDSAYDDGYEAGQAAALRSPAPAATVTGWRLLEVGEVIQAGDEFWDDNVDEWCLADRRIYDKTDNDWPFRRRLSPPALTDVWRDTYNELDELIGVLERAHIEAGWIQVAPQFVTKMRLALAAVRGAGGEGV